MSSGSHIWMPVFFSAVTYGPSYLQCLQILQPGKSSVSDALHVGDLIYEGKIPLVSGLDIADLGMKFASYKEPHINEADLFDCVR